MKKRIASILTAAAMCFALAGCTSNSGNSGTASTPTGNSGTDSTPASNSAADSTGDSTSANPSGETVNLKVWAAEEDQNLTKELIERFKNAYPDTTFSIQVGVKSEGSAKDDILKDVSAGPDVYAFANDQLNELIRGNAVADLSQFDEAFKAITGKSINEILAENGDLYIDTVTKDGKAYGFPFATNNYYLYYDSSVLTEDQVKSWDDMLAAASAAGKKVGMVFESGWYNASFFLGAGFELSSDETGKTVMNWNETSKDGHKGVDVAEGMIAIGNHAAYYSIPDGGTSAAIASGELCAVVSGSWDTSACYNVWGKENTAATKLPTYTCGGKQVQMGTFSGSKAIAVNPMSKQGGWAAVLAQFLTNEESQATRFEQRLINPTNKNAASVESVKDDPVIAASALQDEVCGVVQDVGGKYWTPASSFGKLCHDGTLKSGDTEAIQTALDKMVEGATADVS